MEQATQQTSSAAPPETRAPDDEQRAINRRARDLSAQLLDLIEQWPFSVETEEDFPSGFRTHFKFRADRVRGLLQFAQLVDAPVTRATTQFGVHVEALARVQQIEFRASALLSVAEARDFDEQVAQPNPGPGHEAVTTEAPEEPATVAVMPAPTVQPLGSSVNAYVPVVAPAADGEQ